MTQPRATRRIGTSLYETLDGDYRIRKAQEKVWELRAWDNGRGYFVVGRFPTKAEALAAIPTT